MRTLPRSARHYMVVDPYEKGATYNQVVEPIAVMSFAEKVLAFEGGKIRKRLEALGVGETTLLKNHLPEDTFPSVAEAARELNEMLDLFEKTKEEDQE